MTLQSEFYTTVLQTRKEAFCHKSFVSRRMGGGGAICKTWCILMNMQIDGHTSSAAAREVWVRVAG